MKLKLCYTIVEKYGIKLIEVVPGDENCKANGEDCYKNSSYCSDKTIWLGIYDNEELKLLSFFHELAHILDQTDWSKNADATTEYKAEKHAWELAYKLAAANGIKFTRFAKEWAKEQLETYRSKEV
jgi:Zn-dependent peptidase ImmA (M78 family)